MNIRPARPDEADALTALAMRSKAYWGYSTEFMDACRDELTVTEEDIAGNRLAVIVAETGNSLVGYFSLSGLGLDECELDALFVDPPHIAQGIGRQLMDQAIAVAHQHGARSLLIQCDPNAERFYRAAGAVKVGERESGSIPGRFLPEFRLTLVRIDPRA